MAKPPEFAEQLPPRFRWRPGPITDRIDMEYVLEELEQGVKNQVIAAHFETVSAMYKTMAEGAAKIAGIVAKAPRG